MKEPLQPDELKALVFDIDGTLYRQSALRRAMLFRLVRMHRAHPVRGWRAVRVLRAYRQAQEWLRDTAVAGDIADAQIALTCERTNVSREEVVEYVSRWMEQEPLRFLPQCIQPGLIEFLRSCKRRGLRLGTLSDYPAELKLRALGLSGLFDVTLCAQSPDINVFKPNPRGLLVALDRLGSTASATMYIGDRVDVDTATAAAAGVRCAILTRRRSPTVANGPFYVASYSELQELFWPS